MQAPRLGKEKHTGLVAYELTELAVDWLQELVGEEGGDKKVLDNLPAPNVDLEGRRRRILQVRATGPLSREASDHALKVQELFSEGRLFPEAERAGACFYVLLVGRETIDDALATRSNASSRRAQRTRQPARPGRPCGGGRGVLEAFGREGAAASVGRGCQSRLSTISLARDHCPGGTTR